MNKPTIGERIRVLRALHGISGEQLANALGVTKATISLWEQGKTKPKNKYIPLLAKLANMSVEEFLNETIYLDDEKTLPMMSDEEDVFETREIIRRVFKDREQLIAVLDSMTEDEIAFLSKAILTMQVKDEE